MARRKRRRRPGIGRGRPVLTAALLAAGGMVSGAALMYWLDPDRGRGRRTQASSHTKAALRRRSRRMSRQASRRAHYMEGKVRGAAARASGHGRYRPASDVDLREHLRQVVRSLPVPTSDVTVDVCDGTASLRGQVEAVFDEELVCAAVAGVPGVIAVEDYLHMPGTVAPNKKAVLDLTADSDVPIG